MFDYEATDADEPIGSAKNNFKINFFFTVIDTTLSSLTERFALLQQNNETFKIVHNINALKEWNREDLLKHCKDLQTQLTDDKNANSRDIDGLTLFEEINSLQCLIKNEMSPHALLNFICETNLQDEFPNISIVLRIFLTLPVSVASGERTFSKLKIIKNYLRSTIAQERLTDLSMISIENDIMDNLNISELIRTFVATKARRVQII